MDRRVREIYRDLSRDLIAEVRARGAEVCDCDEWEYGLCSCRINGKELEQLAHELERRLWLADLEADRGESADRQG